MNEKKIYIFEVETTKTGQARPYADTINEFIITNKAELSKYPEADDRLVERFCKSIIASPVRFIDSPCHFDSTETLTKLDDRRYRYTQVIPSTH